MGEIFAGRYELVDLLGTGGMGAVWRAWDQRTQSYVAAKVLQQRDSASLLRFIREQAMRIEDPHVVKPLGWAGEDDRVLFTMPLIRGGSVATLLGDFGPLPQRWVCELLRQLLIALAAVHAAGVVHRDVKPGNLLLEPTGTARPFLRLSDFGIALPLTGPRLTRTDVVIGTAGYLSPEVAKGADPTPAQDLYAAGRVGIAMVTGVDAGRDDWAVGVHPALAGLLERLTEADPGNRPADGSAAVALAESLGLPGWVDEDDGVEVFEQVPALPTGPPSAVPPPPSAASGVPTVPAPAPTPWPVQQPDSVDTANPGEWAGARRVLLGTGVLVATVGLLVLLVLRPWSSQPPAIPTTPAATTPAITVPETTAAETTAAETTVPESSLPEASLPVPAPTGSNYAGDECTFADVGVRETAPDGELVSCERQADGTYRWVAAG